MEEHNLQKPSYPLWNVIQVWWPLAASWLLMSTELPALTAVVARLPNPEVNLAAYGGVVAPLALIIEAPILMLLAASTTLSKDWYAYQKMRRYMMTISAFLTVVHILIAFTPLYDLVVVQLMGIPKQVVEPARIGLMIMTPWTWSIAYRRFNQGVLIRTGNSKAVGIGSAIRISTDILVLIIGFWLDIFPGVVVGSAAVISGVMTEAIYIGFLKEKALRHLKTMPLIETGFNLRFFLNFYVPLALTSIMAFIVQPLISAALSRMPEALNSLAVWPVTSGLFFILRSFGLAYNEVVISLLDTPGAFFTLRRFSIILGISTTLVLIIVAATPLSVILFGIVYGLPENLVALARNAIWFGLPLPAAGALQSWYQGNIMYNRVTRGITEAVALNLIVTSLVLWFGVVDGRFIGLNISISAMVAGILVQIGWLFVCSRPAIQSFMLRINSTR